MSKRPIVSLVLYALLFIANVALAIINLLGGSHIIFPIVSMICIVIWGILFLAKLKEVLVHDEPLRSDPSRSEPVDEATDE